jgi:deoxyhypusine synthase
VTWGKVDRNTYQQTTESVQGDYSMIMPFVVRALLENRERYARRAAEIGEEALFAESPKAAGYLRPREGYRLFDKRTDLVAALLESVKKNGDWLLETLRYPLAIDHKGA